MPLRFHRVNRRFTTSRSPLSTGCLLAILALAAVGLIFSFSDLRARAVQMTPLEGLTARRPTITTAPAASAEATPTDAPDRSSAPPTAGLEQITSPTQGSREPLITSSSPLTSTLPAALQPSASVPVSDLIFLTGNSLARWDRRQNRSISIAENVIDFSASRDSRFILTLHPLDVTVNGEELFDLRKQELETGAITPLLKDTPRPLQFALSPEGKQAAYFIQGERTLVYLLETDSDKPATIVGACEESPGETCLSLALAPEGKTLAWSDGRGVWLYDPDTRKTRLVHGPQVEVRDPEGQISLYGASFYDLRWSADERFLLLRIVPEASEVSWQGVVDVRTGALASIPDSHTSGPEIVKTEWLSATQVFVIHAGDPLHRTPPFIHIWNVFTTNPEMIVSSRQYDLYSDHFPFNAESSKSIPIHQVNWVAPGPPGKILLAIKLMDAKTEAVVFALDLQLGSLTKIQTLPNEIEELIWSRDGSGALAVSQDGRHFFLSLLQGGLVELRSVIAPRSQQYHWLAPTMPKKSTQ